MKSRKKPTFKEKPCTVCGTMFTPKSGASCYCSDPCRKTHKKAYCEAHKEDIAAWHKAYREAHKEELAAQRKIYRAAHQEEVAARNKAYYEAHKEKYAAWHKAYREAHKEELAVYHKAYREAHTSRRISNVLLPLTGSTYSGKSTFEMRRDVWQNSCILLLSADRGASRGQSGAENGQKEGCHSSSQS